MSYLRYLCLLKYISVQHIMCCVFVLFVFVLYTQCYQCLFIFNLYCPFGIHLSSFTCFNICYGYLCMREINVSLNKLYNEGIVHFKHKHD